MITMASNGPLVNALKQLIFRHNYLNQRNSPSYNSVREAPKPLLVHTTALRPSPRSTHRPRPRQLPPNLQPVLRHSRYCSPPTPFLPPPHRPRIQTHQSSSKVCPRQNPRLRAIAAQTRCFHGLHSHFSAFGVSPLQSSFVSTTKTLETACLPSSLRETSHLHRQHHRRRS